MELHSLTWQNVLRSKSLSDRHRCGERENCLVLAYSAWMLSLNYRSVDSRLKVRRTQKNRRCAWAGLELCLFEGHGVGCLCSFRVNLTSPRWNLHRAITEIEVSTWVASLSTAPAWFTCDCASQLKIEAKICVLKLWNRFVKSRTAFALNWNTQ